MGAELLRIEGMVKNFGATKALQSVDFVLNRGEIRGFVGENGSGKSTMSSIVAGIQSCDSGKMFKDGKPYEPHNVAQAREQKVAMIVQEMGTISNIGVAANIFLGEIERFTKFGRVNRKRMYAEAAEALENIGVTDIDTTRSINSLNFEDRKLVEVASAMRCDPDVLIVDETTTALSQRGRSVIYKLMSDMAANNKAVIFISHDLDELMAVCTHITVLRDGIMIGSLNKEEFEPKLLQSMMVGRELKGDYYRGDYDGSHGEKVMLSVKNLWGLHTLRNINLEVHEGEILGLGGLSECGMHDLGRVMFGIDKFVCGEVLDEHGNPITTTHGAAAAGVGYVSKNRDQESLMLQATIGYNISLPSLDAVSAGKVISLKKEHAFVDDEIKELSIKCQNREQKVRALSGGNKQKVAFAKWVGKKSKVLVLDCPTRGVDIGVKAAMYQLIYKLKKEGTAIVLISEELPELIGMSDRILIMKDGAIQGEYMRSPDLTEYELIQKMI